MKKKMTMIKIHNIIGLLVFGMTGLTSCFDDQLEIFPNDAVADEVLFSTEQGAEAALIALYHPVTPGYYMFSAFGMEYYGDASGTGVTSGPASADAQALSAKSVTPGNRFARRWYYEAFRPIAHMNSWLYFAEQTPFEDPARKVVAAGEVHYHRAMYYFRLVQLYGSVPAVYEVPPPLYPERASPEENYARIIEDLEIAIRDLPWENSGVLRPGDFEARITKGAAICLMARVLMTAPEPHCDLDRAITLLNDIVYGNRYELLENYEDLWNIDNKNNKESIHLISLANYQQEGSNAASLSVPSQIWFRPTVEFYDSFEPGDSRRDVNIERLLIVIPPPPLPPVDTLRDDLYLFKLRYDPRAQNGWVLDNFPMYYTRKADMILLLAEALAVKDLNANMDEILSLIEQVRNRAFKGESHYVYTAADFPDLQAFKIMLWWERRKELFFEIQCFWDAKRLGIAQEILGLQDFQLIFPFGSDALAENPNLVQNSGY
jgi:hypothetical protein